MDIQTHHFQVPRTARFVTLGNLGPQTRELWFAFHGYGMLAHRFIHKFIKLVDQNPGLVVVAPEGLSRFYLGDNVFEHVGATWMTKDEREYEIEDQQTLLNPLYDRVMEDLDRKHVKVFHLGFSQGVATVWRWLDQQPHVRADGLVLWAGKPPHQGPGLKARHHQGMPIHFAFGNEDPYITPERMEDVRTILQAQGLTIQEHPFEGDHRVQPDTLLQIRKALLLASPTV